MQQEITGFPIPYGIKSPNKMFSADSYAGPYLTLQDAYDSIPEPIREIGRLVGILNTDNKSVTIYRFIKNELNDWELKKETTEVLWNTIEGNQSDINLIGFEDGTDNDYQIRDIESETSLLYYEFDMVVLNTGTILKYVTYNGPKIYRSIDGGNTWTVIPLIDGFGGQGRILKFNNLVILVRWIGENNSIYFVSEDDGETWTRRTSATFNNMRIENNLFCKEFNNELFIVSRQSTQTGQLGDFKIIKSSDKGVTFNQVTLDSTYVTSTPFFFIEDNDLYLTMILTYGSDVTNWNPTLFKYNGTSFEFVKEVFLPYYVNQNGLSYVGNMTITTYAGTSSYKIDLENETVELIFSDVLPKVYKYADSNNRICLYSYDYNGTQGINLAISEDGGLTYKKRKIDVPSYTAEGNNSCMVYDYNSAIISKLITTTHTINITIKPPITFRNHYTKVYVNGKYVQPGVEGELYIDYEPELNVVSINSNTVLNYDLANKLLKITGTCTLTFPSNANKKIKEGYIDIKSGTLTLAFGSGVTHSGLYSLTLEVGEKVYFYRESTNVYRFR